jgi:hypothetical protein
VPISTAPHHTPDFIDESGFVLGMKTMSNSTDYMEMQSKK